MGTGDKVLTHELRVPSIVAFECRVTLLRESTPSGGFVKYNIAQKLWVAAAGAMRHNPRSNCTNAGMRALAMHEPGRPLMPTAS
jgi:hypothetical protein